MNDETLPLAAMKAMKFGCVLDQIICEIILVHPSLDPVKLIKLNLSDDVYRVNLNIDDIPKLGMIFLTRPG